MEILPHSLTECVNKMFAWSDENIQSQLPLQPGNQLCMTLALYGYSDFLLPPVTSPGEVPVHFFCPWY